MKFRYFYGSSADQYSFIRIPKLLITGQSVFRTDNSSQDVIWSAIGSYGNVHKK